MRLGVSVDQQPLIDAQRHVGQLVVRFNQLQRIAGFALATLGVGAITESADTYTTLSNRLKAVTTSAEEFARVEKGVFDIADKTSTPVEDQAAAYQRFATRLENLNLTTEDTLDFQLRLSQGLKLSGATAQETSAVLIQLGQGMGNNFKSGGQEINSLVEQAGSFATELAKAIAGPEATASQLKEMAKQGKLTGKAIVDAVRSMGTAYDKLFSKRVRTFEENRILFHNRWMQLMKQLEPAITRVSNGLVKLVGWVKEWVANGGALNNLIAALVTGLIALTGAMAPLVALIIRAAAPWLLLFVAIEDFVGFMNGSDSLIGRFFDAFTKGGQEGARAKIQELFEIAKSFFAFLKSPSTEGWQSFFEQLKVWIHDLFETLRKEIQGAKQTLKERVLPAVQETIKETLYPEEGSRARKALDTADQALQPVNEAIGGAYEASDQAIARAGEFVWNKTNSALQAPTDFLVNGMQALDAKLSGLSTSFYDYFFKAPQQPGGTYTPPTSSGGAPANVTNNITVQGNADAQTAREIGKEAGKGTSAALGRDRSAIGAGVGVE